MLTPEERRGALTLLAIAVLGAIWEAAVGGKRPAPPFPASSVGASAPAGRPGIAIRNPSGPGAAPLTGEGGAADTSAGARVLDLNRASAAELEALPGIGPVLAARIVDQRARFGRFQSVDELRAVRGVGPRLLERLRDRVRVGSTP